jgi:hypothetical protein
MSAALYFVNRGEEKPIFLSLSSELDMSLSNASYFLASVGMNPDFNSEPEFSIGIFEEKLNQFIANHGPNSPLHDAVPAKPMEKSNWIDCGRRENYLIEKVWRAISMLREAKEKGATHGYFA